MIKKIVLSLILALICVLLFFACNTCNHTEKFYSKISHMNILLTAITDNRTISPSDTTSSLTPTPTRKLSLINYPTHRGLQHHRDR